MGRRFFIFLLFVTLVFGASYASALINRLMGPWTAVAIEQDGSTTRMQFDPNLPRPDWVQVYPGAVVAQTSMVTSNRFPSGLGTLDITTRASFEEVKRFYTDRLESSGFEVTDEGIGPLNPATAVYLGVAGTLSARRAATDDKVVIQIRTPDGLLLSRQVQLHWHKIREGER